MIPEVFSLGLHTHLSMYVYMYLNTYKHTHTYKISVKFRKEERLRNYLSIWKLSIFFSVVKTLEILRLIIDFLPVVPTNSYRTSRHFESQKVMLASPMQCNKDS